LMAELQHAGERVQGVAGDERSARRRRRSRGLLHGCFRGWCRFSTPYSSIRSNPLRHRMGVVFTRTHTGRAHARRIPDRSAPQGGALANPDRRWAPHATTWLTSAAAPTHPVGTHRTPRRRVRSARRVAAMALGKRGSRHLHRHRSDASDGSPATDYPKTARPAAAGMAKISAPPPRTRR
jgi:hypothetical protein